MLKKKISFIIMIVIIIGISIQSFAFDLDTNVDNKKLEGNQIEITLKTTDLQEYTNGINAISGKLVYDSDVFENISFEGLNNWTCAYNSEQGNENLGKFMLITTSGNVNEDTEVGKIKINLKPGVDNIQTKIKIQQIETSYQHEKVTAQDKELTFKIVNNTINLVQNNIKKENTSENKNVVKQEANVTNAEKTKQNQDINFYIALILIIVLILMIILIIFIIKTKKGREYDET